MIDSLIQISNLPKNNRRGLFLQGSNLFAFQPISNPTLSAILLSKRLVGYLNEILPV